MADELMTLEAVVGSLPDPVEFRRRLLAAARRGYEEMTKDQVVHLAEDTHAVQSMLARARELSKQFESSFKAVDGELAKWQRDQLELLPAGPSAVRVPDAEGDLVVQLDTSNSYSFDEGQLLFAVAADMARDEVLTMLIELTENATDYATLRTEFGERLAVLLVGMVETVAALGSLKMQVTKVNAYADQLQRDGNVALASVVRGTIIKATETKPGAKFTRKGPKK